MAVHDGAAPPELVRVVVAASGRTKANFSDGSVLVLNPSGRAFAVLQGSAGRQQQPQQQQRQLTDFVLSRHAAALAVVLEFRNMHLDAPAYCARLLPDAATSSGLRLGFRMCDLYWPGSVDEALASGLVQELEGGKVSVSTDDDAGRIVLHSHRRRFAVCYPVLVRELPSEGMYDYAWQTQVFSMCAYPPRWAPAVELLLRVAAHLDQEANAVNWNRIDQEASRAAGRGQDSLAVPSVSVSHGAAANDTICTEGALVAAAPGGGGGGAAVRTELPHALPDAHTPSFQDSRPAEGWWAEATLSLLPSDELCVLEWTPQATYQFHPDTCEVEVWIHADESVLATRQAGRFVAHVRPPRGAAAAHGAATALSLPPESLYAADCVPESVWAHERAERYALAPLAAHAGKLRAQMAAVGARPRTEAGVGAAPLLMCITGQPLAGACAGRAPAIDAASGGGAGLGLLASAAEETFAVQSEELLDESDVPGVATYGAYADGRVRARFADRTLLHTNADRSLAKLVLPDGSAALVSVAAPVGVEGYVGAALAYARWAFASPEQRAAEARAQAAVQSELSSASRMRKMLEWTASKRASGGAQPLLELTNLPGGGSDNACTKPAACFSLDDVNAMLQRNQELLQNL